MHINTIVAMGSDDYWLQAVAAAARDLPAVEMVRCPADYLACLAQAPEATTASLLIVDATGQRDVAAVVRHARSLGWRHLIVMAADPSWKEARAVLREAHGFAYDYLKKSYVPQVIRSHIEEYLADLDDGASDTTEGGPT